MMYTLKGSKTGVIDLEDASMVADELIRATIVFDKIVYGVLNEAILRNDPETWTLTDSKGNTWIGSGWISTLQRGDVEDVTFYIEITPERGWAYIVV